MYGYIYETTNLINGKKYIGQKKSGTYLGTRYLGRGKIIKQAIEKYGRENFTNITLKECNNQIELDYFEKYYIKYYNAANSDNYYNLAIGGEGGNTIKGFSDDSLNNFKNKISNAHKGRVILNKDGKEYHVKHELVDEYLSKGYKLGRGNFIKSDKYRKAQSERAKGKRSEETRKRMSNSFKGRIYSEETRKRMSEAAKNRVHTYWMYKDNKEIKVRLELIDEYLSKGYKRGRLFKK